MAVKKKSSAKKDADKASDKKATKTPSIQDIFKAVNKVTGEKHVELQQADVEDYLSTGILALDLILGGGYFGGRVLQFSGAPGAGKSTVGYTSAGCLQKRGIYTGFYDPEGTTERAYATRLGVDFSKLNYLRPLHGPATYKHMLRVLTQLPDKDSGMPQCAIVLDTIAQMATEEEVLDPDNKQNNMPARRAAMHSKWMGAIKTLVAKKHVALVAINQVRKGMSMYQPESRPGGNAWEYATDNLVKMRKGQTIEVNGAVYQPIIFKTLKNKNFQPLLECQVMLHIGEGIDPASDVIEFLKLTGLWKKVGKGKEAKYVLNGLDPYANGTKLDGTWTKDTLPDLEQLIRDQMLGDEPPYYTACQRFLKSGEATKALLEERKKAPKDDKKKKRDTSDEIGAEKLEDDEEEGEKAEGEGEDAAPEQTEAPAEEKAVDNSGSGIAKLKKKGKKVA